VKAAGVFFFLGVLVIPFNGISGVGALGELKSELCVYFFLAAIAAVFISQSTFYIAQHRLNGVSTQVPESRLLIIILSSMFVILVFSGIFNAEDIMKSEFHQRSGVSKYLTSLSVIVYGMLLAYSSSMIVRRGWKTIVAVPVAVSAVLSIMYGSFELLHQHGAFAAIYDKIDPYVHANSLNVTLAWNGKVNIKVTEGWDVRLRALCFEPPAFGAYSGFALPWIIAGAMSSKSFSRMIYATIAILFTILILVARARTGWLLLGSNCIVFGLLRFVYLRPQARSYSAQLGGLVTGSIASVATVGLAYYGLTFNHTVEGVIRGDSVSNLTRLASQLSGFNMFLGHPLVGVGLGQYAFHDVQYMPSWGYMSYELKPWLVYPTAPWPAVFSIYARLGAETGLVGLVGWIGLWLGLAILTVRRTQRFALSEDALPLISYPLIMNYFGVLVAGIANDSFRNPMFWIALGIGGGYLTSLAPARPSRRPARLQSVPILT
jgi:hypothetical protein